MNIAFFTLGCKVNQYETSSIIEKAIERGHKIVDFNEKADAYIINTCTVTAVSDKKSRQIIHRAEKLNPDAIIAVMGCYSQTNYKELEKDSKIDIILGTSERMSVLDYIEKAFNEKNTLKEKIICVKDIFKVDTFENMDTKTFYDKTRAVIKIQDGCENFCSYCIIPFARGKVRSKKLSDIKSEAEMIGEQGYKEIVLTGIHLDSYGKDFDNISLLDAVEICQNTDKIKRIRLGSLEPVVITEKFLEQLKTYDKVCPHFHLSLQSGCDETLKRMNRNYTCEDYRNAVKLIRKFYDMPGITTDVMTGFAGEDEDEFKKSLDFVKEIGFLQVHIFPYSRRKGTKAYNMPNQNTKKIKEERVHKMIEAASLTRQAFFDNCIGKEVRVLFERKTAGYWEGFSENYMPVKIKSEENLENVILKVILKENKKEFLLGEKNEKGI